MGLVDKALQFLGGMFGPPPGPAEHDATRQAPMPTPRARQTQEATVDGLPAQTNTHTQSSDRIMVRPPQGRGDPLKGTIETPVTPRTRYLAELARRVSEGANTYLELPLDLPPEQIKKSTHLIVISIYEVLEKLCADFNELVSFAPQRVTATETLEVREPPVLDAAAQDLREGRTYFRCRATSTTQSLCVRGRDGLVECFLVPVNELMLLSQAESASRLKLRLSLTQSGSDQFWSLDGFPLEASDLKLLIRNLFRELLLSALENQESKGTLFSIPKELQGEKLSSAVHQLVMERQNLVQKIVTQQEEIQNSIARDLHDAVIADVMMLKRSLSGDHRLSDQEVVTVLDQITQHLREICHDLSPRDLKDWGLQTVMEDLLHRISERTGADCALTCDSELPDLPNAVQLHIYRIVQECLNNIEKYAQASKIVMKMDVSDNTLILTIEDDGKGFDIADTGSRRAKEGGSGMGSIRERAELIRCFYPTKLAVESEPNKGSRTTLSLKLSGSFDAQP